MIHRDIEQAQSAIANATTQEEVQYWCKRVMKNIIRAGFCLCIPIIQEQTREIPHCRKVFVEHYPEFSEYAEQVMKWIECPTDNAGAILSFLDDDTRLFLAVVDRWMEQYNPERLDEMPHY